MIAAGSVGLSAAGDGPVALLAFAAVAAVALLAGLGLDTLGARGGHGEGRGEESWRWAASAIGGLVAVHVLLLTLDLLGVPWSPAVLALTGVAIAVPGLFALRAALRRIEPTAPGAGALVATAAVALYGWFALSLWAATPDFVYHWGAKGHRYFAARGIDWAFLTDPLRLTEHPDYPNLLPDLYAAVAVVAGRFEPRSAMLWSVLFLALIPIAARTAWRRLDVSRWGIELGTVAVVAATVMFGVGYRLAGGGDLAIALALAASAPSLLAPRPDSADDLRLGLAAAFAAGVKIEGIPLAAVLLAVYLVRRMRTARETPGLGIVGQLWGIGWRTVLPAIFVILPWAIQCWRHDLFQASNPSRFDPSRVAEVLPALIQALGTREWHGLAWLVPLALPLILTHRRTRGLAMVCALQLAFYLWVYLSSPLEPTFFVLSSFPRLLAHLLPAILIALVAAISLPKERPE